jgi:lipopolysaccharide/colanic/teichoic acid biosynthesis glycosyltransferase
MSPLINIDVSSGHGKSSGVKIKRLIDILGASVCMIALLPLMLLTAIVIKCSSKGPVLFTQKRVGFRGQQFTFLKFRTMSQENDDSVHRSHVTKLIKGEFSGPTPNNISNQKPMHKLDDDSRVTKIGGFLRIWSLDELPQFLNVLKGEMSLVGPRPPIPYEVEHYSAWHLQRLDIPPGMTGLWQIMGRSKTTFDEMARLDIQYTKKWSLWLDFKILLRTFGAVMSREGAS